MSNSVHNPNAYVEFDIPENPEYNPHISRLRDNDPASATFTFNPLFQRILNNIHFLRLSDDKIRTLLGWIDPLDTTVGAVGQFFLNLDTGGVFVLAAIVEGKFIWVPIGGSGPSSNVAWLGASFFGSAFLSGVGGGSGPAIPAPPHIPTEPENSNSGPS